MYSISIRRKKISLRLTIQWDKVKIWLNKKYEELNLGLGSSPWSIDYGTRFWTSLLQGWTYLPLLLTHSNQVSVQQDFWIWLWCELGNAESLSFVESPNLFEDPELRGFKAHLCFLLVYWNIRKGFNARYLFTFAAYCSNAFISGPNSFLLLVERLVFSIFTRRPSVWTSLCQGSWDMWSRP